MQQPTRGPLWVGRPPRPRRRMYPPGPFRIRCLAILEPETFHQHNWRGLRGVPLASNGMICVACCCGALLDAMYSSRHPWRQKPKRSLRYWEGGSPSITRAQGFSRVSVWCVGYMQDGSRCHHHADVPLDRLPDWPWQSISAHFKCTNCGCIGYVDTRLDWGEVIDFGKGSC
jgi:hypothetical protein